MALAPSITVYTDRSQMPERFRDTLEQMMKSQAYRELAAARMFGHGLQFVEEAKWLKFMVWHIGEETEHFLAVARMYEKFTGDPVDSWVHRSSSSCAKAGATRSSSSLCSSAGYALACCRSDALRMKAIGTQSRWASRSGTR